MKTIGRQLTDGILFATRVSSSFAAWGRLRFDDFVLVRRGLILVIVRVWLFVLFAGVVSCSLALAHNRPVDEEDAKEQVKDKRKDNEHVGGGINQKCPRAR